jgi:hypothetical protein
MNVQQRALVYVYTYRAHFLYALDVLSYHFVIPFSLSRIWEMEGRKTYNVSLND